MSDVGPLSFYVFYKLIVFHQVELVAGEQVVITTNPSFMDICDKDYIWVDYPNIIKVVDVNKNIYIDDGLISLTVVEKGKKKPKRWV